MKLRTLTIKNFRSITKASKVPLSSMTVLLGPNNEGKSNVLRALVIAMRTALGLRHRGPRRRYGVLSDDVYDWERDFPVHLQEDHPDGHSEFILEFELSKDEEEAFYQEVGSRVKTPLPIEVRIGPQGPAKISFRKKGPHSTKVTEKRAQISEFIAQRMAFDYIPAVRTAEAAAAVVDSLMSRELEVLEASSEYADALARVRSLQQPILAELASSVAATLKQFLPAVREVIIEIESGRRFDSLHRAAIMVDDGSATDLRYKGDGVQSLAALALLRFAASRDRKGKDVVLALEEPESHLHPLAIHELRDVLQQLADTQQIVLTTHCALFVDRQSMATNVIVEKGRAKPAKTVDEVRAVLGVRPSDNLQHAELVLVVEGEDDRLALQAVLAERSVALKGAIKRNRLAIDTLGGATNLAYKLGLLRDALCEYVCFLDGDKAGRGACETAIAERLLDQASVSFAIRSHQTESELEDFFDDQLVQTVVASSYGIPQIAVPSSAKKMKWSDRMGEAFRVAGKPWDDFVERELKMKVAHAVAASPATAIRPSTSGPIDNLVAVLEARLGV